MNTRTRKGDMVGQIEYFKREYLSVNTLKKLGWSEVESVDGRDVNSWAELRDKLVDSGLSNIVDEHGWLKEPLCVKNQSLFTLSPTFLKMVSACKSGEEFLSNVEKDFKLDGSPRVYGEVSCKQEELNDCSRGFTLNMKGLVNYEVPKSLEKTNEDALFQWGPWFTDGHIETGGHDSISSTPIGEKLFLICRRGCASVSFERLIKDANYFIHFVKSGPQDKFVKENIQFYISSTDSFMCQPALCAHAVLTFSRGPSLVLGWEATKVADDGRWQDVFRYYSFGLQAGEFKRLLDKKGTVGALEWSRGRDKGTVSGLTEHLEQLVKNGQEVKPSASKHTGRPKGPSKKQKRAFNLRGQKEAYEGRRRKVTAVDSIDDEKPGPSS